MAKMYCQMHEYSCASEKGQKYFSYEGEVAFKWIDPTERS